MIVEDSSLVAEDYSESLQNFGYTVTGIVASGEEAIVRAKKDRPDAVIMDIHLRDKMDGIEAAEYISKNFEIPVIFLSAYYDTKLLSRASTIGAYGYLIKPFNENELFATLEMALFKKQIEVERFELEERLVQATKIEGFQLMAGSIAHRFNNILQSGLLNADFALEELPSNSPIKEFVRGARDSISKAAELSGVMNTYLGSGVKNSTTFDLVPLFNHTLEKFNAPITQEIKASYSLAEDCIQLNADEEQVAQLIQNLLLNASEALQSNNGYITATLTVNRFTRDQLKDTYLHKALPDGQYAIIEIEDNGSGIDEDSFSKIFDPFYTTKFTGRGLGLAIVYGIILGHNAAINVDSKVGVGTTFTVMLPLPKS